MSQETTGWFKHELNFEGSDLETVSAALENTIRSKGFKKKKENKTDSTYSISAMYGSRIIALSLHIIPIVGRHLPAGKRCFLEATVSKVENGIKVILSATPYMELFDCEEFMPISQSVDEKATDEYFASLKLFKITQDLHRELKYPIPSQFEKLEIKPFAKDTFWRFLLYPLDGFSSPKPVHMPNERGPFWCWSAFVIPEIWFLWHEIWGASILAVAMELLVARYSFQYLGFGGILLGAAVARLVAAYWGHRIYYFRYGRWVNA